MVRDGSNDQTTKAAAWRRQTEVESIHLQPIGRGFQTLEQQDVVSTSLPRKGRRGQK